MLSKQARVLFVLVAPRVWISKRVPNVKGGSPDSYPEPRILYRVRDIAALTRLFLTFDHDAGSSGLLWNP